MVRDEELNRLVRYAQGMGLSVRFKPYVPYSKDQAEWHTDGTEIVVFVKKNTSKLEKILSLIHELGHHKSWIENGRKIDPKFEDALGDDESKRSRRIVYLGELNDTQYWEQIYRDTDCRFNPYILHMHRELDVWMYEVYYETGKFPTHKEKDAKKKQLKEKFRC